MANILLHSIEFLQNNPFGTYVAGDVIDVYCDTDNIVVPSAWLGSTDGITASLNGVPFGSPSNVFISLDSSIVSIVKYDHNFCSGTYLIQFSVYTLYHYGSYIAYADHPSCVVNPSVCDLMVVGIPSVVGASASDQSDGSITVSASSSNSIEYNLGQDFQYGDGQASGLFSGLLPGQYRIYLRDSINCAANVLVDVPVDNSYGTIYQAEYDDRYGSKTRILISKRSYTGSVTETCESGEPFIISLRGEGSVNKFEPILSTTGNINLLSESNFQYIEIYNNDPRLYRLTYQKDFGSGYVSYWTGWILPSQYQEEYKFKNYYVNVIATDGLAELKTFYLEQPSGLRYFGEVSLIKLISYCLQRIGLGLNIRVAVNLYAITKAFSDGVAMDATDSDDPLDQAYVDYECFYIANNGNSPDLAFVLRHILKAFGCQIILWENVWNIIRVEEKISDYDYRVFDSDGDYVSNGTYSPVLEIGTGRDVIFINNNQFLEINRGYGKIRATYKLGLKDNILYNGDFRLNMTLFPGSNNSYIPSLNKDGWLFVNGGYPIIEGYEELRGDGANIVTNVAYTITGDENMLTSTNGGEAYLQSDSYTVRMGNDNTLKIGINVKVERNTVTFLSLSYTQNVQYVKVRVRVKYGSLYLMAGGDWSTTENILTFFLTEFNKYTTFEILANQPTSGTPTSGMAFDVRVYHAYAYYAEFQSLTALRAFETYDSVNSVKTTQDGYKTEVRDTFTNPFYMYYYELEENTDSETGYDIVRPDDYHVTNNPRQWILKTKINQFVIGNSHKFKMAIDYVRCNFLTSGQDPFDSIIRTSTGEANNQDTLEEELIIGSYSTLITTERSFNIGSLSLGGFTGGGLSITTKSILSAELIYTGWLRASNGDPYEFWKRDDVAEADKLHGIFLNQLNFNYKQSWRMLRGDFKVNNSFFGFLNVFKEINDSNRIYMPISLSLDDLNGYGNFELLEMVGTSDGSDTGSTGGGGSPFSSAFSTAFGNG